MRSENADAHAVQHATLCLSRVPERSFWLGLSQKVLEIQGGLRGPTQRGWREELRH